MVIMLHWNVALNMHFHAILILHGNDGMWSEEFISLGYDVDRVINDMHEVKLDEHAPYWSLIIEYILRKGHVSHGKIL